MAEGTTSETAVGGMVSKISAAKLATAAGCGVFIARGAEPDIVPRLLAGAGPGTFFVPSGLPLDAKKRWLAYFQRPTGTIEINARAAAALREQGRSLLAVGIVGASGEFAAGEVVNIAGPGGAVVARGKSAFSREEVADHRRAAWRGRAGAVSAPAAAGGRASQRFGAGLGRFPLRRGPNFAAIAPTAWNSPSKINPRPRRCRRSISGRSSTTSSSPP